MGWGFFLESRSYRRGVDTSHVTKDCPTHVNVDERSNPCYWREQRIVDLRGLCFQTWQKAWFDHNCQPLDLFSWRYFTLCFYTMVVITIFHHHFFSKKFFGSLSSKHRRVANRRLFLYDWPMEEGLWNARPLSSLRPLADGWENSEQLEVGLGGYKVGP